MSDLWTLAHQVAATLPRSGYAPTSIPGPPDDRGHPTTMRGWVLGPGSRRHVRVGDRLDTARIGAWQKVTTTLQILVLAQDGAIWAMDHTYRASGTAGPINATTSLAPASLADIADDPARRQAVERALRRLMRFSE